MGGHPLRCGYEPSLDDLLAEDEVMMPVLKSAGLDRSEFRELLRKAARRIEDRFGNDGAVGFGAG